jgi:hypothetical protein
VLALVALPPRNYLEKGKLTLQLETREGAHIRHQQVVAVAHKPSQSVKQRIRTLVKGSE